MLTSNRIYQEDCITGMSKMDDKSVDVIVTSPPYNLNIKYNSYKDNLDTNEYLNWIEDVIVACKRVLRDDGSFFLNVGGSLKNPWIPFDIAQKARKHFYLQNTIHWIKSISIPEENISIGHYKPINSNRFHHIGQEYIFHFTKNNNVVLNKIATGVDYKDKSNIKRWKSTNGVDKHDRGNVWYIPYETVQSSKSHPAAFPIKLPEMCIRDHGIEKTNLVLDPFMGSGSTAIACRNLSVDYIGFEIDLVYASMFTE